jgi:hypothetical protein
VNKSGIVNSVFYLVFRLHKVLITKQIDFRCDLYCLATVLSVRYILRLYHGYSISATTDLKSNIQSLQRNIKDVETLLRAPSSLSSSKSSWPMHIPIARSGSNEIANAKSVQRSEQEEELGITGIAIKRGYWRSKMVER